MASKNIDSSLLHQRNSSICTALLLQLQEMFSNSFIKHDVQLQFINIDKNPTALLKTMPLHYIIELVTPYNNASNVNIS